MDQKRRKKIFYGILLLLIVTPLIYQPIQFEPLSEPHTVYAGGWEFVWVDDPSVVDRDAYVGTLYPPLNRYQSLDWVRLAIYEAIVLALAFIIYGSLRHGFSKPALSTTQPHVRNPIPQMSEKVVNCEDCGGIVSLRAESCPHCGAPVGIPES